jgi:nucleotide-binding universal stress UspA family protein
MTGWRNLAFGSVAKQVVELATCPVLVLRVPKPSAASDTP